MELLILMIFLLKGLGVIFCVVFVLLWVLFVNLMLSVMFKILLFWI